MIEGLVNARYEAVITLELRGPTGKTRHIDAVVDTGFTGQLIVPTQLVAELELPFAQTSQARLANGDEVDFNVHGATAVWDGRPIHIYVSAAGPDILVGMRLLDGHTLTVNVKEGGRVIIEAEA